MHEDPQYSRETFKRNLKNMSHKMSSRTKKNVGDFRSWLFGKRFWKKAFLTILIGFLFIAGIVMLWISSLRIPDLQSFQDKILAGSTRIYDRTGQILLYDLNQNVKRQVVPFDQISQNLKNATISIEDEKFYSHNGIELSSIARAILVDIQHAGLSQGGSTITQQVIKNSLLTTDKTFSRKIKEWVLALKLERIMAKDGILNLYLNGSPYGGNFYGIETASENFLGKPAKDLDIAESAYMAALPQAPSYFSPYGTHREALDARKNLVLSKMKEYGYISQTEYDAARAEQITFKPQQNNSIKAPHFVMFIKDYLEKKYGEDMVRNGNLKVITTLDYSLEQTAESVVKTFALSNAKKFNASNAALVAIDPTTGQILSMVGSRDYFDNAIQGNFNVALAHRQPGSSFKPFAYATAFEKGYTPDTVLFDLPTQFSTACDAEGKPLGGSVASDCYMPQNYDNKFLGPISLRNALAQSRNIPSIKTLYLAGIKDTLQTAQDLGITSLNAGSNHYGLTLVLGGGEVSPLEMTSAYSVFANNGVRNPYTGILKVIDKDGKTVEEFTPAPTQALPEQIALQITSILSDPVARLPLNGPGSATDFPAGTEVALKTGTTNDYHDVWVVGYTPTLAVGTWAGNNNNSAMTHKTSGLIIAPLWRAFMDEALKKYPPSIFKNPDPVDPTLKPVLRGAWQGDQANGQNSVHSILYWVDKNDPKGPQPSNPSADPQFNLWEKPIQTWAGAHSNDFINASSTQNGAPHITIQYPANNGTYSKSDHITVSITNQSLFPLSRVEFYLNSTLVGSAVGSNPTFSFVPQESPQTRPTNVLRVVGYDTANNQGESSVTFNVQ
jgi:1A family penicillin-binding protein